MSHLTLPGSTITSLPASLPRNLIPPIKKIATMIMSSPTLARSIHTCSISSHAWVEVLVQCGQQSILDMYGGRGMLDKCSRVLAFECVARGVW